MCIRAFCGDSLLVSAEHLSHLIYAPPPSHSQEYILIFQSRAINNMYLKNGKKRQRKGAPRRLGEAIALPPFSSQACSVYSLIRAALENQSKGSCRLFSQRTFNWSAVISLFSLWRRAGLLFPPLLNCETRPLLKFVNERNRSCQVFDPRDWFPFLTPYFTHSHVNSKRLTKYFIRAMFLILNSPFSLTKLKP